VSARTTIERVCTDLLWCSRQLRNPDEVTADTLVRVRAAVMDALDELNDISIRDLPAEQAAAEVSR